MISCSLVFTFCWQSVRESLSLSSSPFMLALFTIWTRMGVSSPSRASRPCTNIQTGGGLGAMRRWRCSERLSLRTGAWAAHLSEGSSGHLHPALIRGVDLQVVAVGAVQAEETTAWKTSVITWRQKQASAVRRTLKMFYPKNR